MINITNLEISIKVCKNSFYAAIIGMCENAKKGNFILAITYKWKSLALLFSMKTIYSEFFTQNGQSWVFYSKNSHIKLYIHLKDTALDNDDTLLRAWRVKREPHTAKTSRKTAWKFLFENFLKTNFTLFLLICCCYWYAEFCLFSCVLPKLIPANISTSLQRCLLVDMTSRRKTTLNQGWNNVVYFNVGIYNVEQHRINVVCFKVDMDNVRQLRNNVVIFKVDFHNVGQRQNNVVKMTIFEKNNKKSFQIECTEFKV